MVDKVGSDERGNCQTYVCEAVLLEIVGRGIDPTPNDDDCAQAGASSAGHGSADSPLSRNEKGSEWDWRSCNYRTLDPIVVHTLWLFRAGTSSRGSCRSGLGWKMGKLILWSVCLLLSKVTPENRALYASCLCIFLTVLNSLCKASPSPRGLTNRK